MTKWTRRLNFIRGLACAALGVIALLAAAQTPPRGRVDEESVKKAAAKLKDHLVQAAQAAGADTSNTQIDLVLAFCTSSWGGDPQSGEAARKIGTKAASDLLVSGDRLSVAPWELELWESPESRGGPIVIPSGEAPAESSLQPLIPMTPQAGSSGGHDKERAVVQLGERAQANTIVVLLANHMASNQRPGVPLLGANSTEYKAAVEQIWTLAEARNNRGASLELPYEVILGTGERRPRVLDALVLVRRGFSGAALAKSREELRKIGGTGDGGGGLHPLLILLALLGVGGLGVLAYFFIRQSGGGTGGAIELVINDSTQVLDRAHLGTGVYLVGEDHDGSRTPALRIKGLRDYAVARIYEKGSDLLLQPLGDFKILRVVGAERGLEILLSRSEPVTVFFEPPERGAFDSMSDHEVSLKIEVRSR